MRTLDRFSLFRIISFSLAGADVIQTMPGTYKLYRKQYVKGNLSPVCFFYAMTRYLSIISLVSNGIGFFGTDFTPSSCRRFYMLPNVTAMLAGMAVQVLVFIRTYAISGRSIHVWFGLGAFMLALFPVQIFGIVYHRDPSLSQTGACKGKVLRPNETDWNIIYYSAHMTFDLVACTTATLYLLLSSRTQSGFNLSHFVRRVLRNGILYTLVVFLSNFCVVLEFANLMTTGAASTLPLAVVLIATQHLILSTQRLDSDDPSTTEPSRRTRRSTAGSGPAQFFHENTTQDVELRSSAFVLTETSSYVDPPKDDPKSSYRADQKPSLHNTSVTPASEGKRKAGVSRHSL